MGARRTCRQYRNWQSDLETTWRGSAAVKRAAHWEGDRDRWWSVKLLRTVPRAQSLLLLQTDTETETETEKV